MGLCSDSLISSGRGEERLLSEEDRALSLSSIISWSARLTASGTASLPDSLRGRPRFRFGPRKLGEGRLVWWREEVEVVRCLWCEEGVAVGDAAGYASHLATWHRVARNPQLLASLSLAQAQGNPGPHPPPGRARLGQGPEINPEIKP